MSPKVAIFKSLSHQKKKKTDTYKHTRLSFFRIKIWIFLRTNWKFTVEMNRKMNIGYLEIMKTILFSRSLDSDRMRTYW